MLFYLLASSISLLLVFLIYLKTKKNGHIDPLWTATIGVLGIILIIQSEKSDLKNIIIAIAIIIWAYRLSSYLFIRGRIGNDPRYEALMTQWGKKANLFLFLFLQIQAVCAFVLLYALKIIIDAPSNYFAIFIGLAIIIISLFGEAIADKQLKVFKQNNKDGVCNTGLWKYSRHPNYFFEFLFWFGMSVFALSHLGGLWALIAPAMMYYLLNYASGIPPLEEHMLRSRGDAYLEYQKTTSPFFPLPSRR